MRSIGICILVLVSGPLSIAATLAPVSLSQIPGQQDQELVPDPEANQGRELTTDPEYGRGTSGSLDVDVSRTTDADTDVSGIDETGSYGNQNNTTTGSYDDQGSLPDTASELSLIGLIGALTFAIAIGLRVILRRI